MEEQFNAEKEQYNKEKKENEEILKNKEDIIKDNENKLKILEDKLKEETEKNTKEQNEKEEKIKKLEEQIKRNNEKSSESNAELQKIDEQLKNKEEEIKQKDELNKKYEENNKKLEEQIKIDNEKYQKDLKDSEEKLKLLEEQLKTEAEKYKTEFKENDEKLKNEIEKNKEKYQKDLNEMENKLKVQENQLQLEKDKYQKEFKENDDKLKLEIEKYKNELKEKENQLKTQEEQLKIEKEKNNQVAVSKKVEASSLPAHTPQMNTTQNALSSETQEIIEKILSEYLFKLNYSQYFISVFDLLNKIANNYEQLRYFHNLDPKWEEPLDTLYNFYICLRSYFNINQEKSTLKDFLIQKSFIFSETRKEDNDIINLIQSLKLNNQNNNIINLYEKKKGEFLNQIGIMFDNLKKRILSEIKNKKRTISLIDIEKIEEQTIEYESDINFDEIMNKEYVLDKYLAHNVFNNLKKLNLHISNVPIYILYSIIVNCSYLSELQISFLVDKTSKINNRNIDILNDSCPILINYLHKLESFCLKDFPLKTNKLKDFVESLKNSKIKKLSLINCFQKKDGVTPLVPYFSYPNSTLNEIDLSNNPCNILTSVYNSLLNYDVNKKLTSITFSNCKLTDDDITHISNYIVASTILLSCDISQNILSPKSCSQFGYCIPKSSSLETLKMSYCGINPESLLFLFNAKGSKCLKNIVLNGNGFGDIGLVSVSAFIKNSPLLEKIELKRCNGTDMGFITIVNSIKNLQNNNLKYINYQENNITQITLGILKGSNEAFKNKGLIFALNQIPGETEKTNIDCAVFA